MKLVRWIVGLLLISGCVRSETRNQRTPPTTQQRSELDTLRKQVLALQGVVAQIDAFVASDFTTCAPALPAFQASICRIAQTATAEQQVLFSSQIQEVVKTYQQKIYGEDCMDDTSPGCPVAGSMLERLTSIEDNSLDYAADIAILQADVTTLQTNLASINTRLNNFNSSGNTIETVVTGIQSDLTSLDSRLDAVEQTLNTASVWKTVQLCSDIVTSGPMFEAILVTGNNTKVIAYIYTNSSKNGLGVVSEAGVTGTLYGTTRLNTNTCKFKIYDHTTTVKICWKNTDRLASSAAIDISCDSVNNFATPLTSCTCAN